MPQFPHPCPWGPLRHKTIGSFQEFEEPWAELLFSWDQTGSPSSHPIILLIKTSSPQACFPMFGVGLLLESSATSSSQMAKAARASFPRSFPSSWLRQRHNRGQINRNRGAERQSPGRGGRRGQPGLRIKEGEAAALPCSLPSPAPSGGCFRKGTRSVLEKDDQHCMAIAFGILSQLQMFCKRNAACFPVGSHSWSPAHPFPSIVSSPTTQG